MTTEILVRLQVVDVDLSVHKCNHREAAGVIRLDRRDIELMLETGVGRRAIREDLHRRLDECISLLEGEGRL